MHTSPCGQGARNRRGTLGEVDMGQSQPVDGNPKPKPCTRCGTPLIRRPRESDVRWRERKYCSTTCRLKSAHPWANQKPRWRKPEWDWS